jgi:hypothetical protein
MGHSLGLPSLSEQEKKFFSLVAAGDITATRRFLQENPGLNKNCVDVKVRFPRVLYCRSYVL